MKRSEALIELSREHHTALSLAQRARLAAADGNEAAIRDMAAKTRERFYAELKSHFDEEERALLPALTAVGEAELVKRTLAEHGELERLVEALTEPSAPALQAFADALTAHVRFEERELFATAEAHPDCLARLAKA